MSSREKLEQYTNEVEAVIGRFLPAKEGYQSTVLEAMDYSVNNKADIVKAVIRITE